MVGEMKYKKFRVKNHAVAGVIEALLMVALVSIIISMIQLIYIPQIMEQREAEHMDQVSNQFSTLKSMIELQAITNSSAPISTMITLGSRELPYFITARAFGEIRVEDSGEWDISVNHAHVQDLTSITYEASNSYFVDQTYALEGGGIIVKQPNGKPVMKVDPSISVEIKDRVYIQFNLPIFVGIPGKNLTSGLGKCFVRTNWSQGDNSPWDAYSINISTQYPNAWNESLYGMLGDNVKYNEGASYVEITKRGAETIRFVIKYYYIYVQIGHGWIK